MVLVTGGLGYIGSHTVIELIEEGFEPIVIDNLSNSKLEVKDKIEKITGKKLKVYIEDVCNEESLDKIMTENNITDVIHFAGYKAVGESVAKPIMYYENNLLSTISLLKQMKKHHVKNIIFSSSATVYGQPEKLPITEDSKVGGTTNPYGTTKLMIEKILSDVYKSDNEMNITILRYFNPVGGHVSGLLGESPNGIPNNLMPYIVRVAVGKLECLSVFGNDYDTKDGTGVRDYIHVVDLAKGHIAAIKHMNGLRYYNLGTGTGYSVLELVNAFEKVNNLKVNYKIVERRPGDIASCYADPSKALKGLNWKAEKTLEDMMKDSYRFIENESKNGNL
jgi:UDP-glucose 4-epimerase